MSVIDRFQYPDGSHMPLSNFYHSPFTLDGYDWPTVEHYFQAQKAANALDYHAIRSASTPGMAKKLGRKAAIRPGWDAVRLDVMRCALRAKFRPGSQLAAWLLATEDALLVEGNSWGDRFWGVDGTGSNWLGALLMVQRAELRSGEL